MAKRGFSTCKGCGIEIITEESIIHNNKKYCKVCGEIKLQEAQDYKDLVARLCEYLQIDVPTGLIVKQIKDYKEQYNYTYGGMNYSLYYAKEIKGMSFEAKYGIAILKYVYKEAEDYFLQQLKVQESVTSINNTEDKIIKVKLNIKKKDRKPLLINIDELIGDGEV